MYEFGKNFFFYLHNFHENRFMAVPNIVDISIISICSGIVCISKVCPFIVLCNDAPFVVFHCMKTQIYSFICKLFKNKIIIQNCRLRPPIVFALITRAFHAMIGMV